MLGESGYMRPQLGAVVSFDSRLDEARLRKALNLLLRAEPVLGYRFAADAKPPVWQQLEAVDEAALLRVVQTKDAPKYAAQFVAESFDPCTGPQLQGALIHGPGGDALAIKMAHVAVDGGAVKETLYLIGEFYRTLADRPDWTPVFNFDGVRHPMAKGGLVEKIRALRSAGIKIPKSDWASTDMHSRGPVRYFVADVDQGVLSAAAAQGRKIGATVNDIILAAYYRTLFRVLDAIPSDRTPIQISCELRKHLPVGTKTALSNISSTWYISVQPVAQEDFDGTLTRVVEATSAWKRSGAGKPIALTLPLATKLIGKQSLKFFQKTMSKALNESTEEDTGLPTLTNIGIIDEEHLDFGASETVLDAWFLGPLSPGMLLTTSTFHGRLHLSMGVDLGAIDERMANRILGEVAAEIIDWANQRSKVSSVEEA